MGLKDTFLRPRFLIYVGIFIFLLFMPKLLPIYQLMLMESGITFAIMCLGFNLLLRYTGLLSFGHGALFATGAYAVGMMGEYFPDLYRIEILIPISLAASLIVSAIFGFICVRHTRIFFSILALALSMVLFALLVKLYNITGGSDGIHIDLPIMFGKSFEGMKRFEFLSGAYYYFLIGIFAACTIIMLAIVSSPFGKALQSIRDNEVRAPFRSVYRFGRSPVELCEWSCQSGNCRMGLFRRDCLHDAPWWLYGFRRTHHWSHPVYLSEIIRCQYHAILDVYHWSHPHCSRSSPAGRYHRWIR
jgi:hypothetical protein